MRRISFTSPNDHVPPVSYPLRFVYKCVYVCVLFDAMIHLFSHSLFSIWIQNRMNKKNCLVITNMRLWYTKSREKESKQHKIFLSRILVGGTRATFFFGCFCYYYCWIKVHFEKTIHAIPSIYIIIWFCVRGIRLKQILFWPFFSPK